MSDLEEVAAKCETVRVSVGTRVENVVSVTLNRPDARNALNQQLREELIDVLDAIDETDAVHAVVITGAEEGGAFASGADVSEFEDMSAVEMRRRNEGVRIYERVETLSKPVIARIHGYCLGGACELAMACDVRIASDESTLGQPEISLALLPGGGGTQRLPRLVGEGHAMRLVLSGEFIDGNEASEIGLVDEVYPLDDLDDRVYGLAQKMAEKSPVALEFAKRAVKASSRMGLDDGLDYEKELFAMLFSTEDAAEGTEAFLEKRDPDWRGR